jgi:hypothetical protein
MKEKRLERDSAIGNSGNVLWRFSAFWALYRPGGKPVGENGW